MTLRLASSAVDTLHDVAPVWGIGVPEFVERLRQNREQRGEGWQYAADCSPDVAMSLAAMFEQVAQTVAGNERAAMQKQAARCRRYAITITKG